MVVDFDIGMVCGHYLICFDIMDGLVISETC